MNPENILGYKQPYLLAVCKRILEMALDAYEKAKEKDPEFIGVITLTEHSPDFLDCLSGYKLPQDAIEIFAANEKLGPLIRGNFEQFLSHERHALITAAIHLLVGLGFISAVEHDSHPRPRVHTDYAITDQGRYFAQKIRASNGNGFHAN